MTMYRLKIGVDPIEFTSTGPEGFIDAWRSVSLCASDDYN